MAMAEEVEGSSLKGARIGGVASTIPAEFLSQILGQASNRSIWSKIVETKMRAIESDDSRYLLLHACYRIYDGFKRHRRLRDSIEVLEANLGLDFSELPLRYWSTFCAHAQCESLKVALVHERLATSARRERTHTAKPKWAKSLVSAKTIVVANPSGPVERDATDAPEPSVSVIETRPIWSCLCSACLDMVKGK
jgi:hypothetical protein